MMQLLHIEYASPLELHVESLGEAYEAFDRGRQVATSNYIRAVWSELCRGQGDEAANSTAEGMLSYPSDLMIVAPLFGVPKSDLMARLSACHSRGADLVLADIVTSTLYPISSRRSHDAEMQHLVLTQWVGDRLEAAFYRSDEEHDLQVFSEAFDLWSLCLPGRPAPSV